MQRPVAVHDAHLTRGTELRARPAVALVLFQRRVRHAQLAVGADDGAAGAPLLLLTQTNVP